MCIRDRLRPTFVPVTTGITGATDIEVLSGLEQGDEIVTGRYEILRNLKSEMCIRDRFHPMSDGATRVPKSMTA